MPSPAPAETQRAPVATEQPQTAAGPTNGHADDATPRPSVYRFSRLLSAARLRLLTQRISSLIAIATVVAVATIALGIVFHVLDANTHKWLVSDVEDAARWLAGPFDNTFMVHSEKLAIALNWGIAIVVFAIVGRMAARLVRKLPDIIVRRR